MPDATAVHNITYPIGGDWLKSPVAPAKLALDIKATAVSADIAITAEGGRAQAAATTESKAHADAVAATAQDTAIRTSATETQKLLDALRQEMTTSHLALDSDGTPFVRFGSTTLKVLQDTDGTPYYEAT